MDSSILKAVGFVRLHVHSAHSLREGAGAFHRERPTSFWITALCGTVFSNAAL
jgi:hypothetical protein